jgi:hypothetical protein
MRVHTMYARVRERVHSDRRVRSQEVVVTEISNLEKRSEGGLSSFVRSLDSSRKLAFSPSHRTRARLF